MAQKDWKRYYLPVLVDNRTGHCRVWQGMFFRKREQAYRQGKSINNDNYSNFTCIGVAAIRANKSHAELQKHMLDNSR